MLKYEKSARYLESVRKEIPPDILLQSFLQILLKIQKNIYEKKPTFSKNMMLWIHMFFRGWFGFPIFSYFLLGISLVTFSGILRFCANLVCPFISLKWDSIILEKFKRKMSSSPDMRRTDNSEQFPFSYHKMFSRKGYFIFMKRTPGVVMKLLDIEFYLFMKYV